MRQATWSYPASELTAPGWRSTLQVMTQPSDAGRPVERWEYFFYEASREGLLGSTGAESYGAENLDSYGAAGWEAVSMVRDPEDGMFAILLKRRVTD